MEVAAATVGATSARQGDAAGAEPGGYVGRGDRGKRGRDRAFKVHGRAALHAGGDFLAEQFQEEFGHVQSGRLDGGLGEIGAFEKEALALGLGNTIDEAVAEIQPG